jgi:HemY protein
LRLGAHGQAAQLLRDRLGSEWDQRLAHLYGDVQEVDAAAQQSQAEQWLEQHPDDAVLLLALAKISLRNQLWGKAHSYLEASIGKQPTAEAYRLLGGLLEQLDEPDKAAECYRQGLALSGAAPVRAPALVAGDVPGAVLAITRSA